MLEVSGSCLLHGRGVSLLAIPDGYRLAKSYNLNSLSDKGHNSSDKGHKFSDKGYDFPPDGGPKTCSRMRMPFGRFWQQQMAFSSY